MYGAVARMTGRRRSPLRAGRGVREGGQFISKSSVLHAVIRNLLGAPESRPDTRRSTGRFTGAGGSVVNMRLKTRAPRADDRVADPDNPTRLGTVQAVYPRAEWLNTREVPESVARKEVRIQWDDGKTETRPLDSLLPPEADRQMKDPRRSFDAPPTGAPEPRRMDTDQPGRPRSPRERLGEIIAAGRTSEAQRRDARNVVARAQGKPLPHPAAPEKTEVPAGVAAFMAQLAAPEKKTRAQPDPRDVAAQLAAQPSESAVIALLSGDSRMTAARLRKVAEALNIDVPEGMRAKSALQLHIAERVARDRGVTPAARLAPSPAVAKMTGRKAPKSAFDAKAIAARVDAAGSREEADAALEGLDKSQLRMVALEANITIRNGSRATKADIRRDIAGTGMFKAIFQDRDSAFGESMGRSSRAVARMTGTKAPAEPPGDVARRLQASKTREEAVALLEGKTVAQLKEIAKASGTSTAGAGTKDFMRARIVEHTVGFRLNSEAIRGGSWQRPNASVVRQDLLARTPAERRAWLAAMGLGPTQARLLAKELGVKGAGRMDPGQAIDAIVRHFDSATPDGFDDLMDHQLRSLATEYDLPNARSADRATLIRGLRRAGAVNPHARSDQQDDPMGLRVLARGGFRDEPAPEPVAPATTPEGPEVSTAWTFDMGPDVAEKYGRTSGDESLYLPNGGADQGLVHLDSQLGGLWRDLVADKREPNSRVNAIARIGEDVGTGKLSLDEAAGRLRDLAATATDQGVARRLERAARGISAPPAPRIDVPDGTPRAVRRWLDELAQVPTMRRTDLPGVHMERSVLDRAIELVRGVAENPREYRFGFEGKVHDLLPHESVDGVYQLRRLTGRLLAHTIVTGHRTGPGGRPEAIEAPNPDWPSIQEWLRGGNRPGGSAADRLAGGSPAVAKMTGRRR